MKKNRPKIKKSKIDIAIMVLTTMVIAIAVASITLIGISQIQFEEEIIYIGKILLDDEDDDLYRSAPRGRGMGRNVVEHGLIFTENAEFLEYIRVFDYTDYYIVYSNWLPIKKATVRYEVWEFVLEQVGIMRVSPRSRSIERVSNYELDESVERTPYIFLYKRAYSK